MANPGDTLIQAGNENSKIIIHLDLDAFEVQVWLKKYTEEPEKFSCVLQKDKGAGKLFAKLNKEDQELHPIVLVNYTNMIVSKNHEALLRYPVLQNGMFLKDLRNFPELVVLKVPPTKWAHQDTITRMQEDDQVLKCILEGWESFRKMELHMTLERKLLDEVTIDATDAVMKLCSGSPPLSTNVITSKEGLEQLTKNCSERHHLASQKRVKYMGQSTDLISVRDERLIVGAGIANYFMEGILSKTGYTVSAGVAYGAVEAKEACQENKPRGINIDSTSAGMFYLHPNSLTVERDLKKGTPGSTNKDGAEKLVAFVKDLGEDFAEKWNYRVSTGAICGANVDFLIKITIKGGKVGVKNEGFKPMKVETKTYGGGLGMLRGEQIKEEIWKRIESTVGTDKAVCASKIKTIIVEAKKEKRLKLQKKRVKNETEEEPCVKIPKREEPNSPGCHSSGSQDGFTSSSAASSASYEEMEH